VEAVRGFYRNPKDFWAGVIYIIIGAGAILIAQDYELGTARSMGPAYFPVLVSSILMIVGLISLVRSFVKPGAPITGFAAKGLPLVLGATILFAFIVRGAGLVIALPVLVLISAGASQHFRLGASVIMALGLTVFCVVVFLKGLGVPLPLWGTWWTN
jgi:putative tricarboxylic transport membrane protein